MYLLLIVFGIHNENVRNCQMPTNVICIINISTDTVQRLLDKCLKTVNKREANREVHQ